MESKNITAPEYLYKILSYRNWQATENRKAVALSADDDAFIHLSTQEQLDKIISKYWSDSSQFVILKLRVDQLKGELKYETNPGGTTKYYHLYRGFIPFDSIVESKIIYNDSLKQASETNKLNIVQVGDLVLRKKAKELTKEEILSSEIQNLIENMKLTMRSAPGVGLAAPQIGLPLQLIVIEDMDHSHLTQQQLVERERFKVPFHVIINPKLYLEGKETAEFFEGCLSVPECIGIVPRAKEVRVECLNEKGEPVVINAKGWYARILQHEIDHINGILYIDKAILRSLMTGENFMKLWKDKSPKEILEILKNQN